MRMAFYLTAICLTALCALGRETDQEQRKNDDVCPTPKHARVFDGHIDKDPYFFTHKSWLDERGRLHDIENCVHNRGTRSLFVDWQRSGIPAGYIAADDTAKYSTTLLDPPSDETSRLYYGPRPDEVQSRLFPTPLVNSIGMNPVGEIEPRYAGDLRTHARIVPLPDPDGLPVDIEFTSRVANVGGRDGVRYLYVFAWQIPVERVSERARTDASRLIVERVRTEGVYVRLSPMIWTRSENRDELMRAGQDATFPALQERLALYFFDRRNPKYALTKATVSAEESKEFDLVLPVYLPDVSE